MMEDLNKQLAKLEALLFIHGEPISKKKAMKILEASESQMAELLHEFRIRTESEERGVALFEDSEKIQLATKPQFGEMLQAFIKEELTEELSPASLEALSIVAYLGPVSRSRIDYIRGVNSAFILRSLLMRGLVERSQDPQSGTAYLYRPSFECLRHLGVKRQEDLPDYEKISSILAKFEIIGAEGGKPEAPQNT